MHSDKYKAGEQARSYTESIGTKRHNDFTAAPISDFFTSAQTDAVASAAYVDNG